MSLHSQKPSSHLRVGRALPSLFVWALVGSTVSGCAGPGSGPIEPPSRSLGARHRAFEAAARPPAIEGSAAIETREVEGELSLRRALTLALLRNPELAAFSWESRAREADALQAGLLPNPTLSIEAENLAGSGPFSGYDNAETTVMLGQLVQLGGKRAKRQRVAELERDLADWDYEVKRLDVFTSVTRRFIDVLEAQYRLRLARELRDLAEESLEAVSNRVRMGAASSVERTRAAVNASSAAVALRRAEAGLAASRADLAALWGSRNASFDRAVGDLEAIYEPPELPAIRDRLANNPDVARWASERAHRRAFVKLQDAERIPDITLAGGLRRLETSDDSALVLGLTIPLPLFDRNQGARDAARFRESKAGSMEEAAVVRAARSLEIAYQGLRASHDAVLALREEVLPQAERAYVGVRDGYLRGLFRYVDVLDAQRTLFELRAQELSALGQFHRAAADVERLTGTPLDPTTRPSETETDTPDNEE